MWESSIKIHVGYMVVIMQIGLSKLR